MIIEIKVTGTILNRIHEAIYQLEELNIKREDMIMICSPLIERLIIDETYKSQLFSTAYNSLDFLAGVKVNPVWCYNEIIVYDKEKACYNPELIKKITFDT